MQQIWFDAGFGDARVYRKPGKADRHKIAGCISVRNYVARWLMMRAAEGVAPLLSATSLFDEARAALQQGIWYLG